MTYKRCVNCGRKKPLGARECPHCGLLYAEAETEKERENWLKRQPAEEASIQRAKKKLIEYFFAFIFVIVALGGINSLIRANNNYESGSSRSHAASSLAWHENGTLHRATVLEWKEASYRNRLATAADWALTAPQVSATVRLSENMSTLKPYAADLVTCLDKAVDGNHADDYKAFKIAAMCMTLMWPIE